MLLHLLKSAGKACTSSLFETFQGKFSNYSHSQQDLRDVQGLVGTWKYNMCYHISMVGITII